MIEYYFPLLVMMLIMLVCIFYIIGKLSRIESLLQGKQEPRKNEPPRMPAGQPVQRPAAAPVRTTPPAQPAPKPETAVQAPLRSSPPAAQVPPTPAAPKPAGPKKPKEPTAFDAFWTWFCIGGNSKENVSVEYAAATTWLIRAGIIILLCGFGFFLKYSIEKNLIRPELRICLTFLAGLGMLIGGMRGIRKKFHILSVGILSAGIVTLYMGSYAGCKIYTVLPQLLCFGLMVLTTAAAMAISAKLSLLSVALTGCAGGYLTPILLSDGSGNLPFLCVYTVIVSAGILIVSRLHRWRSLEITAFVLSALILAVGAGNLPYRIDLVCLGAVFVNFLVFSVIPVIRKKDSALGLTEWLLPMAAAVWGIALGICMIYQYHLPDNIEGLAAAGYAVLVSAVTLLEAVWLGKRRADGAKLQPAFLCASVFALALAIPFALQNDGATAAGWSILGAVLFLAAAKSGRETFAILGLIVFGAALFIIGPYSDRSDISAFSERFFRGGVFTLSLFAAAWFLRGKPERSLPTYRKVLLCAGGISFFLYTSFELFRQLESHAATHHFRHGGLSIWWAVLAIALIVWGIRKDIKTLRIPGLALFTICLVKICCVDIAGLNTLGKTVAFVLLGLLFLGGAAAYIHFRKRFSKEG